MRENREMRDMAGLATVHAIKPKPHIPAPTTSKQITDRHKKCNEARSRLQEDM